MTWISVIERLPNKLEKVLFHWVLTDSFGVPCVRNVSMGYMCDAGWNIYFPYHSFGLRGDICPVTHWMELPDFPNQKFPEIDVKILPGITENEAHPLFSISLETSNNCLMDEHNNEKQIPKAG